MARSGLLGSVQLPRDGACETGLGCGENVSLRGEREIIGDMESYQWVSLRCLRSRGCSGTAAQRAHIKGCVSSAAPFPAQPL